MQWQRKGVPLHIVPSQGPMERTLTDLVALMKVLFQEEQKAFHAAMADASDRCAAYTAADVAMHIADVGMHIDPAVLCRCMRESCVLIGRTAGRGAPVRTG